MKKLNSIKEKFEEVKTVLESHIGGKHEYQLTLEEGQWVLVICDEAEIEYAWDAEEFSLDLMHCLAHAFCAEVMLVSLGYKNGTRSKAFKR